jgi:HEAT repeats
MLQLSRIQGLALVLLLASHSAGSFSLQGKQAAFQISDFKSTDMNTRVSAYEEVKNNPEVLKRSDVKAALIDLLDYENHLIETTNSVAGPTVSDKYGEGYGIYVSDLMETVDGIADWHDARQVCILANSSYNPDSNFAQKLAVKGGSVVAPCLLKMARGNVYKREDSIPILVQISAVTKNLDAAMRQQIKDSVLSGLKDSETVVRREAIRALDKFGEPDMIPSLEAVAQTDPNHYMVDGKPVFDIREAAAKAIRSIQDRAKAH